MKIGSYIDNWDRQSNDTTRSYMNHNWITTNDEIKKKDILVVICIYEYWIYISQRGCK